MRLLQMPRWRRKRMANWWARTSSQTGAGSFGFFGPLSVEPKLWEQKVAQRLLEPTMEMFRKWGCRHTGLFTFSHSPKHAALYQKFGYWARFLTPVMSKQPTVSNGGSYTCYSKLSAND